MAVTRIKNNQITDSTVNAAAKLVDYSVSAAKLANNLVYSSDLTVTGNLTVQGNTTTIDTTYTVIEDPVILLASNQVGAPAVDIGFIGQRGTSNNVAFVWDESSTEFVTAYTTTGETNTTIAITNYADLHTANANIGGNLTVNGNVSIVGNVIGSITFTGNLAAGNLSTSGQLSAAGNVTGGNVLTIGIVSATSNITSAANVNGGNVISTALVQGATVSATGNVVGGNLTTAGQVVATGNVNGGNVVSSALVQGVTVSASGNVSGGNVNTAGQVVATGNITGGNLLTSGSGGAISGSGNITGGNLLTGGTVSASGNVVGGNVTTAGQVSATGNITSAANISGGNISTSGTFSAASLSASGNVTGGNLVSNGIVTSTGNIVTTANVSGGNVVSTALVQGATVSATGNVVGGNVTTAGQVSATGAITSAANVSGGNLVATTAVVTPTLTGTTVTISATGGAITLSPSGNVSTSSKNINNLADPVQNQDAATKAYVDNMVSTQLAYHQGVYAATTGTLETATGGTITYTQPNGAGNGVGATLTVSGGTFNLIDTANIQTANTRVLVKNQANTALNGVYYWANATALVRTTDADQYGPNSSEELSINDYFFVSNGNVNAGSAWIVDAPSGTITFGSSGISFAQFSSSQVYTANTQAGISLTGTVISAKVDNNTTAFDGSGNIIVKASANLTTPNIGAATGTSLSVTGNVTAAGADISGNVSGGNVLSSGIVSATGNVTGGNVLTGGLVSAAGNVTSTGNVSGGNILTGGQVSATANVTGGNLLTSGLISATSTITSAANITGGNLLTGGLVSATANITGGNVLTGGQVSATGNITGGNISTSGTFSAASLSITGNVDSGNLNTTGQVVATGNVNGGNIISTALVSGATVSATGNVNGGNVVSSALVQGVTVSASGNVIGGNLTTAGQVSATANITGGNVLTGGQVSATGNVNGGNVIATTALKGGNIVISGDDITDTNGRVNFNTAVADVDFAVNGLTANVFYVDAGTGTASFGNSTQTTNAVVAFNATNSILMPIGNTTQRPAVGVVGMVRFNSIADALEQYTTNNGWQTVGTPAFTVIGDQQFNGDGTTVAFTLNAAGTTNGVIVSINGVLQVPTSAYSVSGTTLTFTEAPLTGDLIDVRALTTTTSVTSISNQSANAVVSTSGTSAVVNITGDLVPVANNTQSLGTSSLRWSNLFVSGTTITLGNVVMKNVAGGNTIAFYGPDGTTPATIASTSVDTTTIANGTSNVSVAGSGGNIRMNVGGTSNVAVVYSGGMSITGDLSVTGNATLSGNILGDRVQNGTTSIDIQTASGNANITVGGTSNVAVFATTGAYVTGIVSATGNITGGNLSGTSIVGTLLTAAQTNITSVGTLGSLTVTANVAGGNITTAGQVSATGNITGGNLSVSTGTVTLGNIVNANGNGVGNIGSSTTYFNTAFVKATSAQYADLAENYVSDAEYEPGTVLSFGGTHEVTLATNANDPRIAGVVSTNPSYIMNGTLEGDYVATIALTGRVPTKVVGPVAKGDMMIAAGNGRAQACATPTMGTVIGKALENNVDGEGIIEVVVGRL